MCIKDVYERNLTNADNIGLVQLKKRRQNSTRIEKNGAGYVFLNVFLYGSSYVFIYIFFYVFLYFFLYKEHLE